MGRKPKVDVARLCEQVKRSRLVLRTPRQNLVALARQLAGALYSDEASPKSRPLNLIGLYVDIESRLLISQEPRVLYSTASRRDRAAVDVMQRSMNRKIEQMYLADTLSRCAVNALFGPLAICKVALASPADSEGSAWHMSAGTAYAEDIDFDDFAYDHHCRRLDKARWMGHRMRMPLEVAQDLNYFSKYRKDLTANGDAYYNAQGDERISMIGRTTQGGNEDVADMVDLWEIYYPTEGLVFTFMSDGEGGDPTPCQDGRPLREQKWIGPACGPYHWLGFIDVPGNALPKGPVSDLYHIDEAVNNIYRKLLREAENCKSVLPVRGVSAEDIERLNNTSDGHAFRCDSEPPKEVQYGGPLALLQAFGEQLRMLFSWAAGNMEMKGGLSPQSKTATQDKILAENASADSSNKQRKMIRFTSGVLDALGWYEWNHPTAVHQSEYAVPGLKGMSATQKLYPHGAVKNDGSPQALRRQVPWEQIDRRVDPYSLVHQTPQQKLQFLDALVTQLQPLMPLLQQQGVMFDANFWLRKKAEYADMPDVTEMFTVQEPPAPTEGAPEQPGMPPNTTREYVRHNRSEVTGPGQAKSTIQALLGQDPGGASGGTPS